MLVTFQIPPHLTLVTFCLNSHVVSVNSTRGLHVLTTLTFFSPEGGTVLPPPPPGIFAVCWVQLVQRMVQEQGTPSGYIPCFSSSAFLRLHPQVLRSQEPQGKDLIRQPLGPEGSECPSVSCMGREVRLRGVIWC